MLLTYTVRESRKAKHVSLKICALGRLEVIIPQGFDQDRIPAILEKKQQWIHQVTQRIEVTQAASGLATANELPSQIRFSAIAENWQVEYHETQWLGIRVTAQSNSKLILSGATRDHDTCRAALRQWVMSQAKLHLVPWLWNMSRENELPFEQVTVRQQKTRWGSCSGQKTISLNAKLLFLPNPLVRYVLIHELCHTVHFNHSSAFWKLVSSYEPNYKELDTRLRDARYCVPTWMEIP